MESRREGGKGGFAGPLARQQAKRAPLSKEDITLSLFQLSPTSTPAHSPSPSLSLSLSLSSFVCWGEVARAERFLLLHTAAPHVQLGTRRARSLLGLDQIQTPSTGLRHPSFKVEEGAGKRCSECGLDPYGHPAKCKPPTPPHPHPRIPNPPTPALPTDLLSASVSIKQLRDSWEAQYSYYSPGARFLFLNCPAPDRTAVWGVLKRPECDDPLPSAKPSGRKSHQRGVK